MEKIKVIGKAKRRIEAEEFARLLGAEPVGITVPPNATPHALVDLYHKIKSSPTKERRDRNVQSTLV